MGQCWGQSIDIGIEPDGYYVSFNNISEVIAREEKKERRLITKEEAIQACINNVFRDQSAQEDDEKVCDIGYYVRIPVAYTDGVNQYVIEGFVDGEYPYC